MYKRIILLAVILMSIFAANAYADGDQGDLLGISGDNEQHIGQIVHEYMNKGKIPGVSLVIVKEGQTVLKEGFGYADKHSGTGVTADTAFQLGSLSKSFTGLAITDLSEKGLIELNKPVSFYLPWFHVSYNNAPVDITLQQLMEHSSGFGTESFIDIPASADQNALEQGVRSLVGSSLKTAPGKSYAYSNVNFNILGLIIEQVSGQTYADYMNEHVFKPLQLTNTSVRGGQLPEQMAAGYKPAFYGARPYFVPLSLSQSPSGFIISNGNDMEKWLKFNLGITQASELHFVHPNGTSPFHYDGGWEFDPKTNQIQHGGNLENYSSYIVMEPGSKTGVVVLANLNSGYTTAIGEEVMSLLQGHKPATGYSDVYVTTDLVSSTLILAMGAFSLLMLWPLANVIKAIRSGRRHYKARPLSVLMAAITLLLLVVVCYVIVIFPTFIFPNAGWSFIFDWMPDTTIYGMTLLLCFLTLLAATISIRLLYRERLGAADELLR